jgi:plastocyanin
VPNSVRLFRSSAHYFDKRGPISWDMAMTGTAPDWRPAVQAGDVLRISATYETRRSSWYESMGIMVVWEAYSDGTGVDPFDHALDEHGHLTHGHLPENNHHGGAMPLGVNPNQFPTCRRSTVDITRFKFLPGDFTATGSNRCTPTVVRGHSITFVNDEASPLSTFNLISPTAEYLGSVFHSVTACRNPCNLNTGISYPLANGAGNFDSGQLGIGTPAIGKLSWSTPTNLPPGTYTFYCRIHPFMRGVFRIIS